MNLTIELQRRDFDSPVRVTAEVVKDSFGRLVVRGFRALVGGEEVGLRQADLTGAWCRLRQAYREAVRWFGGVRP